VKLSAIRARKQMGCSDPSANCDVFAIGKRFPESLARWQAWGDGKYASSTLETCAHLVGRLPNIKIARMFQYKGRRREDITRQEDGATAWRTHISKGNEALRLMFWRRTNGSIELANVGGKFELEIF
jgi:hypothetical protein